MQLRAETYLNWKNCLQRAVQSMPRLRWSTHTCLSTFSHCQIPCFHSVEHSHSNLTSPLLPTHSSCLVCIMCSVPGCLTLQVNRTVYFALILHTYNVHSWRVSGVQSKWSHTTHLFNYWSYGIFWNAFIIWRCTYCAIPFHYHQYTWCTQDTLDFGEILDGVIIAYNDSYLPWVTKSESISPIFWSLSI